MYLYNICYSYTIISIPEYGIIIKICDNSILKFYSYDQRLQLKRITKLIYICFEYNKKKIL